MSPYRPLFWAVLKPKREQVEIRVKAVRNRMNTLIKITQFCVQIALVLVENEKCTPMDFTYNTTRLWEEGEGIVPSNRLPSKLRISKFGSAIIGSMTPWKALLETFRDVNPFKLENEAKASPWSRFSWSHLFVQVSKTYAPHITIAGLKMERYIQSSEARRERGRQQTSKRILF